MHCSMLMMASRAQAELKGWTHWSHDAERQSATSLACATRPSQRMTRVCKLARSGVDQVCKARERSGVDQRGVDQVHTHPRASTRVRSCVGRRLHQQECARVRRRCVRRRLRPLRLARASTVACDISEEAALADIFFSSERIS
eukprot:6192336-Pleurochrysis_carterae.AAC.2